MIRHENVQLLEFKGQKLIVELFNVLASDPTRFLPAETCKKYREAEKADDKKNAGHQRLCFRYDGRVRDSAV